MAALGSSHMFNDQYLDKEENGKIMVSWSFLGVVFFFFFRNTLVGFHNVCKTLQAHLHFRARQL